MSKPKPFFPEDLRTLRPTMGFSFLFNLRKQIHDANLVAQASSGGLPLVNQPPKHVDSITLNEYEIDTFQYVEHFTRTLEKALSGEPNTDRELFELTRMLDNPYSALVFFDDPHEERRVNLSLLHHAAVLDNCDALNELACFYAPPKGHHKYKPTVYSNPRTAYRALIRSSALGSSEATNELANIYNCTSRISKIAQPDFQKAAELFKLAEQQKADETTLKPTPNRLDDEKQQAEIHKKATAWYQKTLVSGTGQPLKHMPSHHISSYYQKTEQAKLKGEGDISQALAMQYLRSEAQNSRPFLFSRNDIAKPIFDLGVMYKMGINGLDADSVKANSLLVEASYYDQGIESQVELMMQDSMDNQPAQPKATSDMSMPRLG